MKSVITGIVRAMELKKDSRDGWTTYNKACSRDKEDDAREMLRVFDRGSGELFGHITS